MNILLYVSIISEQSERIEGPVQCYRCGEIFESMELVKEHQTEKYQVARKSAYGKERPIQCHVCKYMFETEEKKSYHMCRSDGLLKFYFRGSKFLSNEKFSVTRIFLRLILIFRVCALHKMNNCY